MKIYLYMLLAMILIAGCGSPRTNSDQVENTTFATSHPTIAASAVSEGEGTYKIVTSDAFELTVNAPGAAQVELFYQPATASDRALRLKTITNSGPNGDFVAEVQSPADFNGEIWARVRYANGEIKETEHLLLAKRDLAENAANPRKGPANSNSGTTEDSDSNNTSQPDDTDESQRSDKITNGRIKRGSIKPGNGSVRITVNVPAFMMTLWQDGKEIKSYYVGVGRKNFPIPIGMREADKIILNPDWIPPDSEWVRRSPGVEPYERIPADDPQNPLGKIKIPLGDAYLLHEAQAPSDIGNLVSHGCVRVMRDDLFELTKMVSSARNLTISQQEIERARKNSERRVIDLNGEIPVDINYDSMVVENRILTIYPDVYEKNMNTLGNLRNELEGYGMDVSKIDQKTLEEMLTKVNADEKFVVSLEDIESGNALARGKVEPLTPQQAGSSAKTAKHKIANYFLANDLYVI